MHYLAFTQRPVKSGAGLMAPLIYLSPGIHQYIDRHAKWSQCPTKANHFFGAVFHGRRND